MTEPEMPPLHPSPQLPPEVANRPLVPSDVKAAPALQKPDDLLKDFAPKPSSPETRPPDARLGIVKETTLAIQHRVNGKLNLITGYGDLLKSMITDENALKLVEQMMRGAEESQNTLREFLKAKRYITKEVPGIGGKYLDLNLSTMSDEEYAKYLAEQEAKKKEQP